MVAFTKLIEQAIAIADVEERKKQQSILFKLWVV
jgi:hypothetical protein